MFKRSSLEKRSAAFKQSDTDGLSRRPATPARVPIVESDEIQPMDVLVELYELLEAYSPTWYTDAHQQRAQVVLRRNGIDL